MSPDPTIASRDPVSGDGAPAGADGTPVLTVDHFNLWYGPTHALKDVTMTFAPRQVTALIGPSGCGKSTLLRSLNRLNDLVEGIRTEGDIRLLGTSVYGKKVDVIALRKRMSMRDCWHSTTRHDAPAITAARGCAPPMPPSPDVSSQRPERSPP